MAGFVAVAAVLATTWLAGGHSAISGDKNPAGQLITDAVLVALVAIGISFVATIYPSWSAAKILPAEALRYE